MCHRTFLTFFCDLWFSFVLLLFYPIHRPQHLRHRICHLLWNRNFFPDPSTTHGEKAHNNTRQQGPHVNGPNARLRLFAEMLGKQALYTYGTMPSSPTHRRPLFSHAVPPTPTPTHKKATLKIFPRKHYRGAPPICHS